jgi:hypothetical protein
LPRALRINGLFHPYYIASVGICSAPDGKVSRISHEDCSRHTG